MKGVRFYQEFSDKSRRKPTGNVTAVFYEDTNLNGTMRAIGAVYNDPNSPVAGTSVSHDYLRRETKKISESLARRIHPALFEVLDRQKNPMLKRPRKVKISHTASVKRKVRVGPKGGRYYLRRGRKVYV